MVDIGRIEYLRAPDAEDIMDSGFFSEDDKYQVVSVHGLIGDSRPGSLDEMGDGSLYVMNRGMIFLCMDNPKKGKFNWNRAGSAAAYVAGGIVGVGAKVLIDVAFAAKNAEKKFQKAFEHPLSFCLPYSEIASLEIIKFGGIFGRLKDVVVQITAKDQAGNTAQFWVQAKDEDETWLDLICTMKFVDESEHLVADYVGEKTGSIEYGRKLVSEAIDQGGEDGFEADQDRITKEIGAFIERRQLELGISDDDLLVELRTRLSRYNGYVIEEIYRAVME